MRNVCCTIMNATDNASHNGNQVDTNQVVSASFHAFFGDSTANGTVKIQASNDLPTAGNLSTFTVTNWVDVPNASASISSGAPAIITIANMSYRWVRAVWTNSSGGSTTITVNMNALSI